MSAKELLYKLALRSIRVMYLCTQAHARKAISKKDYKAIKDLVQGMKDLAEDLP